MRRRFGKTSGFTLVELVVVIAILGILAGIGTAGYAGYVKNANKKADMVLVGNVVRAVETGVYSYAHPLAEQIQMSGEGLQFPVGFVVITENGMTPMQSGTATHEKTLECVMWDAETTTDADRQKFIDDNNILIGSSKYLVSDSDDAAYLNYAYESIRAANIADVRSQASGDFCITHSSAPQGSVYYGKVKCSHSHMFGKRDVPNSAATGCLISDITFVKIKTEDSYTFEEFTGEYKVTNTGMLHNTLAAAFGESYQTSAKLKSKDWTNQTNATFMQYASTTWGGLQDMLNVMWDITGGNAQVLGYDVMSKDYETQGQLVTEFAQRAMESSQSEFMASWMSADSYGVVGDSGSPSMQSPFVFDGKREQYCGARAMYNQGVAAYFDSNNHSIHSTAIRDYTKPLIGIGDYIKLGDLPLCVTAQAFLSPTEGVYDSEYNELYEATKQQVTDENGNTTYVSCSECIRLYNEYIGDGSENSPCYQNGLAVYEMLNSVSETGEDVNKVTNNEQFFAFYNNYLGEFNKLYEEIQKQTNGKSAIVVTIYSQDGKISCDVSPSAANPRSEK